MSSLPLRGIMHLVLRIYGAEEVVEPGAGPLQALSCTWKAETLKEITKK